MKKLISLVLALVLALGVFACAEEKPWLFQQYAKNYSRVLLFQKENIPEVWLSNGSTTWLFSFGYYSDSAVITFPCPEGMLCNEFQPDFMSFINDDEVIQYTYHVRDEYSYERLLNRCNNDAYIIYDGSDGIAAYVDPELAEVCAVIKLGGISKNAKLYVELNYNFPRNYTTEKRVDLLTAAAKSELPRVQSQIKYSDISSASDYWTYGNFSNVFTPSMEFGNFGIQLDLSTQLSRKVGRVSRTAPLFVTEADDNKISLFAEFEKEIGIQVTVNMETYSYVDYMKADSPDEVFTLTDERGNVFECYSRGSKNLDHQMEYAHLNTSLLLSDEAGYSADKNYYLNIDFDLYGYKFSSDDAARKAEMLKMLNEFMSGVHSYNPEKTVYVPADVSPENRTSEATAPEATAFRNGIIWGASQQEVLAGENASAFAGDMPLTGALEGATAEQICAKRIETKLSKYTAPASYVFMNGGVEMAIFVIDDRDGSASKYLTGAYSKLYGELAAQPVVDPVLKAFSEAMSPDEDLSSQLIASWQPADDLAIQMFYSDGVLAIFYVNSTFDIDTLLADIEPVYDLSGL